jgi:hypothetical protein
MPKNAERMKYPAENARNNVINKIGRMIAL